MRLSEPLVLIADDDDGVRSAIQQILATAGFRSETFATAEELLANLNLVRHGCVILDVRMPGLSGLDAQRLLADRGCVLPVIFVTGYGDVQTTVRAMRAGALDVLTKPFRAESLIEGVRRALERDRFHRAELDELQILEERYSSLTTREREVMRLVVSGRLNKQIAAEAGTSEKTVKIHRSRVMQKMAAASLADLVRIASRLDRDRNQR